MIVYFHSTAKGLKGMAGRKIYFPARGCSLRPGWAEVHEITDKGRYGFVRGENFSPETIIEDDLRAFAEREEATLYNVRFLADGTVIANISQVMAYGPVQLFVKRAGQIETISLKDFAASTHAAEYDPEAHGIWDMGTLIPLPPVLGKSWE